MRENPMVDLADDLDQIGSAVIGGAIGVAEIDDDPQQKNTQNNTREGQPEDDESMPDDRLSDRADPLREPSPRRHDDGSSDQRQDDAEPEDPSRQGRQCGSAAGKRRT